MIYIFGELEADFKKLQKHSWLNDEDLLIITTEFEKIKTKYHILEKQSGREEIKEFNQQMKNMPMYITFGWNKDKFFVRFDEWKKNL